MSNKGWRTKRRSWPLGCGNSRCSDFEIKDPSWPDYEVFVHSHATTIDYPSHYEPGTDTYHSSVHDPPEHAEVPMKVPAATRLPSDYEAVH